MPIMSAQGESDARVAAWLLATTAIDCLKGPEAAPIPETALNNVFRLLEAARVNPFFGYQRGDSRTGRTVDDPVFLSPARERHVGEVKAALEQAIKETFAEETPKAAIESVEMVLRGVTYPNQFAAPSSQARFKAARFFESLAQQLKFA